MCTTRAVISVIFTPIERRSESSRWRTSAASRARSARAWFYPRRTRVAARAALFHRHSHCHIDVMCTTRAVISVILTSLSVDRNRHAGALLATARARSARVWFYIRGAHARRGRRGDDRITNATTRTATTSSPIPLREYLRNGGVHVDYGRGDASTRGGEEEGEGASETKPRSRPTPRRALAPRSARSATPSAHTLSS
jgi:hypothetical protein